MRDVTETTSLEIFLEKSLNLPVNPYVLSRNLSPRACPVMSSYNNLWGDRLELEKSVWTHVYLNIDTDIYMCKYMG